MPPQDRCRASPGHGRSRAGMHDAGGADRIELGRQGLPAQMLWQLADGMGVPRERIHGGLRMPRATANRKAQPGERLDADGSERALALARRVGQAAAIVAESGTGEPLHAARWTAQWLGAPTPPPAASAGRTGGRWVRVGTPMRYASTSRALACLETLGQLAAAPLPLNRYLLRLTVPEAAWRAAGPHAARHAGWQAQPAGKVSRDWGTARGAQRRPPRARVPSAGVPEEWHALINPRPAEPGTLRAGKIRKQVDDGRLGVLGVPACRGPSPG